MSNRCRVSNTTDGRSAAAAAATAAAAACERRQCEIVRTTQDEWDERMSLSLSGARQRCNYTARAPDHWRRRMRRSRARTGRATMRMLRTIYKRASLTNLRAESFRSMPKINRDKLSWQVGIRPDKYAAKPRVLKISVHQQDTFLSLALSKEYNIAVVYIEWRWRNFVPYLCQLVSAAIL